MKTTDIIPNQFVAYLRTSTDEQTIGIEAQREIVGQHVANLGGIIIGEFVEHASGKNNTRPVLMAALNTARTKGATLIVAKLDRLSRNLAFGARLCEQYPNIVFCDHPTRSALEIGIFFGMAEEERKYISTRTKQALAALKASGKKLGAPNAHFSDEMRAKAAASKRAKACENPANKFAYAHARVLKESGMKLAAVARELNRIGVPTPCGGAWQRTQVERLFKLFE